MSRLGCRRAGGAWLVLLVSVLAGGPKAVFLGEATAKTRLRGLAKADRIVARGISARAFPGAVLAVGQSSGLLHVRAFGHLSYDPGSPRVAQSTLYDLASLTKIVATTSVAMSLVDCRRLDLEAPVQRYVSCFTNGSRQAARIWHLLAHASGLPAWAPLYQQTRGEERVLDRICASDLEVEPGTASAYGDLGMILLGVTLERAGGAPLDVLARRYVFEPLGMNETLFRPGQELRSRIAPTEDEPWRGRVLEGEVHDSNAWMMGGVAGHAGLFSTATDLARLAETLLNEGAYRGRQVFRAGTVRRFTRRVDIQGSTRTLGFETPAGDPWAGRSWSDSTYGHTGVTGTVMWIDPERDLYLILLTNRIHPTRENEAWRQVRRDLSEAVVVALGSSLSRSDGGSLRK